MYLTSLGSPLFSMSRSLSAPVPKGVPLKLLLRGQIVGIVLMLFALSLVSVLGMVAVFYPYVSEGSIAAAETARNIGFGAGVFGLSLVFLTSFHRQYAPFTAPVYALAGGVFMSGLALGFEARFPGIAVQSIFLTLAIFCSMLFLYSTRIIKVTRQLMTFIFTATAAIALTYLAGFLLLLLGMPIPFLHAAGTGGTLWFGFIVTIAAMNLLVDFQRIEKLESRQHPAYMPWFVGLGLMVTLVWLYISVLRLLARVRGR